MTIDIDDDLPGRKPQSEEQIIKLGHEIAAAAAADPGVPFEADSLEMLATVKSVSPADWERVRSELVAAIGGSRVQELERHVTALLAREAEPQPRRLRLVRPADPPAPLYVIDAYPQRWARQFLALEKQASAAVFQYQEKIILITKEGAWFIGS